MNFKDFNKKVLPDFENYLKSIYDLENDNINKLFESMRYSLFSNGKRFRPTLTLLVADTLNIEFSKVYPIAAAIESIHTYSLIHDDLPAMDDDDLRRGKPTNHKIFGEAIAILSGDALLTYCFNFLSKNLRKVNIEPNIILDIIETLSDYAGFNGMIGGQTADILGENQILSEDSLKYIHENKTGKLILASIILPAMLSQLDKDRFNDFVQFGKNIGLIFQIRDDILDEIGDEKILGKPVKSDIKNSKSTYPQLYGLEKSQNILNNIVNETKLIVKNFRNSDIYIDLIDYLAKREK